MLGSAFRQEVTEEDMQPALRSALVFEEIGEAPIRYLVLGPDRAGNLSMRPKYRSLLPKQG